MSHQQYPQTLLELNYAKNVSSVDSQIEKYLEYFQHGKVLTFFHLLNLCAKDRCEHFFVFVLIHIIAQLSLNFVNPKSRFSTDQLLQHPVPHIVSRPNHRMVLEARN